MNLYTIQTINAQLLKEVRDILTTEYDEDDLFRATAYMTAAMNAATGSLVKCSIYKDCATCEWIEASEYDANDTRANFAVTIPGCSVRLWNWDWHASNASCILRIL